MSSVSGDLLAVSLLLLGFAAGLVASDRFAAWSVPQASRSWGGQGLPAGSLDGDGLVVVDRHHEQRVVVLGGLPVVVRCASPIPMGQQRAQPARPEEQSLNLPHAPPPHRARRHPDGPAEKYISVERLTGGAAGGGRRGNGGGAGCGLGARPAGRGRGRDRRRTDWPGRGFSGPAG